jgi:hypothetical protein
MDGLKLDYFSAVHPALLASETYDVIVMISEGGDAANVCFESCSVRHGDKRSLYSYIMA